MTTYALTEEELVKLWELKFWKQASQEQPKKGGRYFVEFEYSVDTDYGTTETRHIVADFEDGQWTASFWDYADHLEYVAKIKPSRWAHIPK